MRNFFTVFILCLPLLSCKLLYGYHNPRILTVDKIYTSGKANKLNVDTDFYFIDTAALQLIYNASFPRVYFFNSKGDLLLSGNCFQTLDQDLNKLFNIPVDSLPIIKHNALESEQRNFNTEDGKKVQLDLSKNDALIIFYWADFLGRITKKKLAPIEKYSARNKLHKIRVVKVNADFRKDWNLSMEQIARKIKK